MCSVYFVSIVEDDAPDMLPYFIEKAKSRTVNIGDTATFICQYSGNPIPEAEWNIPENKV